MIKKCVLGLTVAVAVLAVPGMANADVSTNTTTNDAHGYCVANHLANFLPDGQHGVGYLRSQMTGTEIAAQGGHRGPASCVDTQGLYDPISNNGG